VPIRSPMYNIGASSFSPSPMTTSPFMGTVLRANRIASTAAWSAASFFRRPANGAAAMAAASVTRTRSMARLRSIGFVSSPRFTILDLTPFRSFPFRELDAPGPEVQPPPPPRR